MYVESIVFPAAKCFPFVFFQELIGRDLRIGPGYVSQMHESPGDHAHQYKSPVYLFKTVPQLDIFDSASAFQDKMEPLD